MKKFSKSLLVFFLAVVMAFTMSGLSSIPARADEEPVTPVYTVSKQHRLFQLQDLRFLLRKKMDR